MTDFRVSRFADAEALASAAADEIATRVDAGLATNPRFSLVLAGGDTPRRAYELLAARHARRIAWDRVHVFWSDERCVPPIEKDSNYAMAREALLSRIPIPEANVHRMPVDDAPPAIAAEEHERQLVAFFGNATPGFDLVLLGVGEDGHTASLFPGDAATREKKRLVVAVRTEAKPPPWRLTLTFPVLDGSRDVLFLVAGAKKRAVVQAVVADHDAAAKRFPAAAVSPRGQLDWFVDAAASV